MTAQARETNDNSPLYMQIARKLTDDVRAGRYQVDQALPSERALSEQLNVSRVTARKAIDQLVEQGLVVRKRGSGNYIAPRIEQPLSNLSSFSEQLQQRGYQPGSRWLSRAIVIASTDEQMSLGLSPNTKWRGWNGCASRTTWRWPTRSACCPPPWGGAPRCTGSSRGAARPPRGRCSTSAQ